MEVTNNSKALQGVHTKDGRVFIKPGETVNVELSEQGLKQAKRLKFLSLAGGGKAKARSSEQGLKAEHHGGGKFNITEGETVHLSGLSKADADAFNAMSDEDKATFVEAEKAKS